MPLLTVTDAEKRVDDTLVQMGHSGDFGNAAKMVGKMSKSVMQLISIGF